MNIKSVINLINLFQKIDVISQNFGLTHFLSALSWNLQFYIPNIIASIWADPVLQFTVKDAGIF